VSTPLLQTKLYIPPSQPNLISRPRLIKHLEDGLNHKLTLISAPAGFGKTTLLSEWIHECRRPAAWISLNQGDNNPARFLKFFITALQKNVDDISEGIISALLTSQPEETDILLTGLLNEIAEMIQPFIIVLDDYHVITEPIIQEMLTFIVENQPPQMHLVISGRADPPWPLARLRVRGELMEIRTHDLRFTEDEAATFLNIVMGLKLSPQEISSLEDLTEGWIAGLQMAALSMRGRKDVSRFIRSFSGSHRFILDYLVEEVLDQQTSTIQEFLLKTSILDRLSGPLCDAVTCSEDSQSTLTHLEQANLFLISLDDERCWYRYHHLFADLLRVRLEQAQLERMPILHRRASMWFEQNNLIAEAVSHALEGNDYERVVNLLAGNALAMIYHGELRTLVSWLERLPEEALSPPLWLNIAHAWTLAYAGKFDTIESLLRKTEKALVGFDEHREGFILSEVENQRIVGHIAIIRTYTAALRGDNSCAVDLAFEALKHLPADDLMVRGYIMTLLGAVLRSSGDLVGATEASSKAIAISQTAGDHHLSAVVLCDLAALHYTLGQLHKSAATCKEAEQISDKYAAQSGRLLPVIGYAYTRLSAVLREWNDLEKATHFAGEGLELCKQWGQADFLVSSYIEVAKVLQANGDIDGAYEAILNGKRIASTVSPWHGFHVEAQQVRLWLAHGNLENVSCWVQESGLRIDDRLSYQYLFRYIVLTRVLIAQGEFDQAAGLLPRLLEVAETARAMSYMIEILVLQAMSLQAQGKIDLALTPLERALALAEPEGFERTFIDEGIPMGVMLRQAVVQEIAVGYAEKLLSALDLETKDRLGPRSASHESMVEPLSERELEVLRLLKTHLSSTAIAEELTISVNTVRTHIKNIYSKLNVHNRQEAVQRAQEIELL
jgi:LuxR family maltose regulon positive regulatory protein